MSLITKNNYEAFLLDYIEERLSPELIAELMLFLENNPDLNEGLDAYEMFELEAPSINLENKNKLKKRENFITPINYEEFIIKEIEKENTPEISNLLHLFLEKNPSKQADYIAYKKTKLIAPKVIFNDKKSLKKREGKVIPMYWWYSSAAAVIIILFFLNGLNNGEKQGNNPIATNTELIVPVNNDRDVNKVKEKKVEIKQATIIKEKSASISIEEKKVKEKTHEIIPEKKEEISSTLAEIIDVKIDSIQDTLPNKIEEQAIEEIKYADNVKITYEDEPTNSDASNSTFKTVGQTLTKPFRKKFLKQDKNEKGEVIAYAINVGGFSISRNKRKR
jgi:hypothetical protein